MLNFVALRVAVGAIFPMVVGIALPSAAGKIVGKESAAFKHLRSLGSADAGLVVSRFSCAGRVGLFISVHCDFLVIGVRNYIIFVVTDEALVPMVGSVGSPVGRPSVRMLRCSIAHHLAVPRGLVLPCDLTDVAAARQTSGVECGGCLAGQLLVRHVCRHSGFERGTQMIIIFIKTSGSCRDRQRIFTVCWSSVGDIRPPRRDLKGVRRTA